MKTLEVNLTATHRGDVKWLKITDRWSSLYCTTWHVPQAGQSMQQNRRKHCAFFLYVCLFCEKVCSWSPRTVGVCNKNKTRSCIGNWQNDEVDWQLAFVSVRPHCRYFCEIIVLLVYRANFDCQGHLSAANRLSVLSRDHLLHFRTDRAHFNVDRADKDSMADLGPNLEEVVHLHVLLMASSVL